MPAFRLKSGELLVPFAEQTERGVLVDGLELASPGSKAFLEHEGEAVEASKKVEAYAAKLRAERRKK
jgi:hypothetical protein